MAKGMNVKCAVICKEMVIELAKRGKRKCQYPQCNEYAEDDSIYCHRHKRLIESVVND